MKWKSGDESTERGYKFAYDGLDRFTAATYGEGPAFAGNQNRFNESVTYNDKMGNIHTLQRQGKITTSTYGLMDNLTYAYSGNKLTKVTDAVTTSITNAAAFHFVDGANSANEYTYDANGNITKDLNKNITSITYNSLNLPIVITFGDGNTATYVYDGAGNKLSVAYKSGAVTSKMDYAGNKVYNNGTLGIILTEEGYVTPGSTPTYYYYLKDHQGNNRVVINQSGTVEQVNHYYAFGGLFGEGTQTVSQRYRYNGKEFDTELGLNMYDYGARHYDAAIGRWGQVDPLIEDYYDWSPYAYTLNNPVNRIDPDGRFSTKFGAMWNRFWSGGGSDIRKNKYDQYYYVKTEQGKEQNEVVVTYVYGKDGVKGNSSQSQNASVGSIAIGATMGGELVKTAGGTASKIGATVSSISALALGTATILLFTSFTPAPTKEELEYYNAAGNKNSPHANQKAKQSAKQQYDEIQEQYNNLNSKPNKTPDDKNKIDKLKRQLKQLKQKMDFKGETHSRTAKGGN